MGAALQPSGITPSSQLAGVSCQGALKTHPLGGQVLAAYLLTFQNRCNLTNRVFLGAFGGGISNIG